MTKPEHHQVVIVGGGAAGITVAATLRRKAGGAALDAAIIEPSDVHYYQPAFTLVGAGAYSLAATRREEAPLIPARVSWIRDAAAGFDPANNRVALASGGSVSYDFLVVCPGVELNWERIDGARDALGKDGVCSNYSPSYAEHTWSCLRALKRGATAVFTQPPLPFKCPGAPQKIAYLAADHLRKQGLLNACKLHLFVHAPVIFGVPYFARELVKVAARYGIEVHYQHNLVAVDAARKEAVFEIVGGDKQGQKLAVPYDVLHVTPPQTPPAAVKTSPLANAGGWVDVNQNTMQHAKFANVFGLGDVCSTPNSKTAAAIRKQAPVVVKNLLAAIQGNTIEQQYDGYASCPLTTAYGKVLMAEFVYGGKVTPTLPLDPSQERWINWWIKTTGLPHMYWNYMLKGYEWFLAHNTDFVEPAAG
jgi:sulfide:quinone oxidoreductase